MYLYLVSIFRTLVDACVLSPVKMFSKSQLLDFFFVRVSEQKDIHELGFFQKSVSLPISSHKIIHIHYHPSVLFHSTNNPNLVIKLGHQSINQSIEPSPFNAIIHHQVTTSHGTTCQHMTLSVSRGIALCNLHFASGTF
jgi:hypothetical protein